MSTWRPSARKTPDNRGQAVTRDTSLPPERRAPSAASYNEWRERKRREIATVKRQAAEATSPEAQRRQEQEALEARLRPLQDARLRHQSELERRQVHSRAHTRAVRQLEGRANDRNSVPHYVAMQAAIAEQQRAREELLSRQRGVTRDRRRESREVFLRDAPQGEAARVQKILTDTAASAVARYLHRIGCAPATNASGGHQRGVSRASAWTVVEPDDDGNRPDGDEDALSLRSSPAPSSEEDDAPSCDSSAGSSGSDDADDVPDPGWTEDATVVGLTPAADIRRRTAAMSPEQRERSVRAAANAAAELSAPDP